MLTRGLSPCEVMIPRELRTLVAIYRQKSRTDTGKILERSRKKPENISKNLFNILIIANSGDDLGDEKQ